MRAVVQHPLVRWTCLLVCLQHLVTHGTAYPWRAGLSKRVDDDLAEVTRNGVDRITKDESNTPLKLNVDYDSKEHLLAAGESDSADELKRRVWSELIQRLEAVSRARPGSKSDDAVLKLAEFLPDDSSISDEFNYDDDDDDDGNHNNNDDADSDERDDHRRNLDLFRDIQFPDPSMPRGRMGGPDPLDSGPRSGHDYDLDGDRDFPFNGGSFNLPQTDRNGAGRDRLPVDSDFGYRGPDGFGNDPLGEQVEVLDEAPYSARKSDDDVFQRRFKEIKDDPYQTDIRNEDSPDAAPGVSCPSQTLTQYLTIRYGAFGALLISLLLLYMCAVVTFVHYQWFSTFQNPGDKELL